MTLPVGTLAPAPPAVDDLDRGSTRRHTLLWVGGLAVLLLASIPAAVGLGAVAIGPGTVAAVIGQYTIGLPADSGATGAQEAIVWQVRAPRVLLAVLVGASLALCGAVLQTLVRNVLAEPYLLGVTSGASTGAAATILFGVGSAAGASALTGSAFVGALGALVLVFALANSSGAITSVRLLLAGVAVYHLLYAATSFLIFASDTPDGAEAVLFWLLGSLSQARWPSVLVVAVVTVGTLAALVVLARRLDAMAVGDDTARALGVRPARFRRGVLVLIALCVGAAVAVSGGIAFVGLVVPHVARLCVGGVHRRVLPVSALIGAVFLLWADVLARTLFEPRELPLGIVTAVVGAPLLVLLIRRLRAGG